VNKKIWQTLKFPDIFLQRLGTSSSSSNQPHARSPLFESKPADQFWNFLPAMNHGINHEHGHSIASSVASASSANVFQDDVQRNI
jgi:hypothetical protein